MDSFLIPLFCVVVILIFYPSLMIYVALIAHAGFFGTCFIFAVMASPIVVPWYYFEQQYECNHQKQFDSKPLVWDIDKTLREYIELLKKKNR